MATKVSLHRVTKVTTELRYIESDTVSTFTTDLKIETGDGKEELVITLFHEDGDLKIG
jgi:hypothetical protein|tara:strand:+ start:304 stop:477 length:174 start_codon:yes stop_codon:yes gene_type:complete